MNKLGIDLDQHLYVGIHDSEHKTYCFIACDGAVKSVPHNKDNLIQLALKEMSNGYSLYPHKELIINLKFFSYIETIYESNKESLYIGLDHPLKPKKDFGISIDNYPQQNYEKIINQLKAKNPEMDLFVYKNYVLNLNNISRIEVSQTNDRIQEIYFNNSERELEVLLDLDEVSLNQQIIDYKKRKFLLSDL